MQNNITKESFSWRLNDELSELDTDLEILLTWKKKNLFNKEVSVLINEKILDREQLYVEPHFETIANGVLNSRLKNINPKNIRWFHYNPFRQPDNPDSIRNYSEVFPVYENKKAVYPSWKNIDFLP